MPTRHLLPTIAFALLLGSAAMAADDPQGALDDADSPELEAARTYSDCMSATRSEPDAALEQARTWKDVGGGDPARHCEAVALLNLGEYEEAGRKLEDLAQTMEAQIGTRLRADALGQAGQAWTLAGDLPRAEAAQTSAIDLEPQNAELRLDRAATRFQMGAYDEALEDLDAAGAFAPENAEVYVYRASVHRHAESLDDAMQDVERALELHPDHPEGLLERGILHRLRDDDAAARRDWLRLVEVAPESPAAEAARSNLERMDLDAEGEG